MSNDNENRNIIPEGTYRAKAVDYALGVAGTGTEQIGVACQITQGPCANRQITWYGFFTDGALEVTLKGMRAMGWSTNSLDDLDDILGGKEFDIVIEHEPDEKHGKRARVKWVNAGGVAMKERMSGAAIAKLNQKIRGAAARLGGGDKSGGNDRGGEWRGNGNKQRGESAPWGDDAPPRDDRDAPPARGGYGRRG